MERDGERWREMERDGERWREREREIREEGDLKEGRRCARNLASSCSGPIAPSSALTCLGSDDTISADRVPSEEERSGRPATENHDCCSKITSGLTPCARTFAKCQNSHSRNRAGRHLHQAMPGPGFGGEHPAPACAAGKRHFGRRSRQPCLAVSGLQRDQATISPASQVPPGQLRGA